MSETEKIWTDWVGGEKALPREKVHKKSGADTQRGLLANKAERSGWRQTTEGLACQAEEFEL